MCKVFYIHISLSRNAIRNSGGVSVFINNDLISTNCITRICCEFPDSVILLVKASIYHLTRDLIIYFVYVSPEGSPIYKSEKNGITTLENTISFLSKQYNQYNIFLAGDLNARTKNILDYIYDDNLNYVIRLSNFY